MHSARHFSVQFCAVAGIRLLSDVLHWRIVPKLPVLLTAISSESICPNFEIDLTVVWSVLVRGFVASLVQSYPSATWHYSCRFIVILYHFVPTAYGGSAICKQRLSSSRGIAVGENWRLRLQEDVFLGNMKVRIGLSSVLLVSFYYFS